MYRHFFKRPLDFTLSLIGFIVISPVFFLLWLLLVIANKGAGAFFTQPRPGKDAQALPGGCNSWDSRRDAAE